MNEPNRREFLGLATAGLALAGCGKELKIEPGKINFLRQLLC